MALAVFSASFCSRICSFLVSTAWREIANEGGELRSGWGWGGVRPQLSLRMYTTNKYADKGTHLVSTIALVCGYVGDSPAVPRVVVVVGVRRVWRHGNNTHRIEHNDFNAAVISSNMKPSAHLSTTAVPTN